MAEPSRTVIVTSFTGRLAGVLEQRRQAVPRRSVPTAHDHDPSTCIQ